MAKAPSLWKYEVQRVVGEQSTPRTRKLSTRVLSCMLAKWNQTWVKSCGCRRNGNRRFMVAPWRSTKGAEPDTVKAVSPVLNGGREETYSNATRLAPTQPRFRQQLSPGVRRRRNAELAKSSEACHLALCSLVFSALVLCQA